MVFDKAAKSQQVLNHLRENYRDIWWQWSVIITIT